MPYTTQSSDFWGWYLRHNNRVVWKHLADAGIDVFAAGPSNNAQSFLQLTNILPAMNGGFNRRWGVSQLVQMTPSGAPLTGTIQRTFEYSHPQDSSDPTNTANTNIFIATDNQKFQSFTDSGALFSGYGPSNFSATGTVGAVSSRGWMYYGNGSEAPRKVNPSFTTANTDSLTGIAIPCSSVGSQNYQNYPCVLIPTAATGTLEGGVLTLSDGGSDYNGGQVVSFTGGTGAGLKVRVDNVSYSPDTNPRAITAFHVISWGVGYSEGDIVTATTGTLKAVFVVTVPATTIVGGSGSGSTGLGYTASSSFTVNVSETLGGSGSGGQITCYTDSAGAIIRAEVTAIGSGYSQGYVTIPAPLTGGTQGYATVYTQIATAAPNYGAIVGVDLAGPMSFVKGRQWTVALQNSTTGHTSDVWVTNLPYGPASGAVFNDLTSGTTQAIVSLNDMPVVISSQSQVAGFTQINLTISIPATGLDPQVDTVILLASADGQGVGTLYQVATYLLSDFTLSGGFYTKQIYDTTPDSFNSSLNTYGTTTTLLDADLWAYTDSSGDTFGILLNTPPIASGFLYPTSHQGRLFTTDGQTVYFSKSLDEVTTPTGLTTSKWEECWPGDYQLPIALNNELIIGMKSDGTNLHVGTNRSIFTVYGSDPSNFSVPSIAFAQTGILSDDLWTVIYAEGMPSGFVWLTQDLKVVHSDFSTYREVGVSIAPILQTIDRTKIATMKAHSLTQGPYNFLILHLYLVGQTAPVFLVWETRLQKWYYWALNTTSFGSSYNTSSSFVHQFAANTTSSFAPGSKYLFFHNYLLAGGTNSYSIDYFNPAASVDFGPININWQVQTSWQDCEDSTAIKVVNEIELLSDDAPITCTLYGASSQAQFDTPVVLRTGPSVQGPINSLGSQKFYCAGASTAAKYYSIAFTPVSPGTSPSVLTSFSLEHYPMSRI